MQNIAQSWLVWELTRSPVAIGIVAFFDSMPRLLVGAVGGAIADRSDRRRLLLITQTVAMIQAIIYWLAVWFHVIAFWHIIVLSFCLGIVNTINQTARQSLVNSLVPKEELLNAIGLQSSVFNLSKILGPSAGGVMIAFIGIAGCFFVNALSFLALIYNLHLMELPHWEARTEEQSIWEDIKEGYVYVRGNRRIFHIISLSYVVALFGAPYNRFVPIFATNILRVGPTGFGFLMSAPGLGATIAALVLATVKKTRVGIRWVCACVIGFALSLSLFAFSHIFVLSFAFSGYGRFLSNRSARVMQYRHPNRNPDQFVRPRSKSVFHGPRIMVLGKCFYGNRSLRHRHQLDLRGVLHRVYDCGEQLAHR